MDYFVTGPSGFVGRPLVNSLAATGSSIVALSRTAPAHPNIQWHECDVLEPHRVLDAFPDANGARLVHLAWDTTPGAYLSSPDNRRWLDASTNLVEAFLAAGGSHVVCAGTCLEYQAQERPLSETDPRNPKSPYALAKHELHQALLRLCNEAGAGLSWAHLFNLYGPGEHPNRLVPATIRAAAKQQTLACTEGTQVRDFVHVDDVGRALAALADRAVRGAYNVGSGDGNTVRQAIERIHSHFPDSPAPAYGQRPMSPDDPSFVVADISRIRHATGWTPTYDLTSGIEQTVATWLNQHA